MIFIFIIKSLLPVKAYNRIIETHVKTLPSYDRAHGLVSQGPTTIRCRELPLKMSERKDSNLRNLMYPKHAC